MRQTTGGSIYQRGQVWWIKYYRDGQPVRESSGSIVEGDAKRLLSKRLGKLAAGERVVPGAERVRMSELLDDLLTEYRVNGRRSYRRAAISADHLKSFFGGQRVGAITTATVRAYIDVRQAEKMSNATINRELAALKRAFSLACQAGRLGAAPHIPGLVENNVRSGFFERDQFEDVRQRLPEALRPVVTFAYITGWRLAEITGLMWPQVDFEAGTVRLEPGTTKNKAGRTFPFIPELRSLLEAQRATTTAIATRAGRIIPHVFHRRGKPIRNFYTAWDNACTAAGVPGRLFHDFRRTAVRNLVRAGVPERVAMALTGHKTRAIFDRYNIVSEADLHQAAAKLAQVAAGHNHRHSEGQPAPTGRVVVLAKAAK